MNLTERYPYLKKVLALGESVALEDSSIDVTFHEFKQQNYSSTLKNVQAHFSIPDFCNQADDEIEENYQFTYPIFTPRGKVDYDKCILLLHGLNERTWEKYGCWAEELAQKLNRPVLLFPIAFHMNRSPKSWSNPRESIQWVRDRKKESNELKNATYLNVALSDRLSCDPMRFYVSGAETVINLLQLIHSIKEGSIAQIASECQFDVFAYSIGGMIAQVLYQSEISKVLDKSHLFLFCSGGVFEKMDGNSRFIMDNLTFEILQEFYSNDFIKRDYKESDPLAYQFQALVSKQVHQSERETFYKHNKERIRFISLKKDKVIPTRSIEAALGEEVSLYCLKEMDFPFEYSHETPFPVGKVEPELLDEAFQSIFQQVIHFFSDNKV